MLLGEYQADRLLALRPPNSGNEVVSAVDEQSTLKDKGVTTVFKKTAPENRGVLGSLFTLFRG